MQSNLRAISPEGSPLNASFGLGRTEAGFEIIVESRSGTNRSGAIPRNPQYEEVFELILKRAASLGALLAGAWVVSASTTHLSDDERALLPEGITFPVALASVADIRDLRVRICGMQGGIGRQPGALGPGNRNKRVLLRFALPSEMPEADLLKAFIDGESPTANYELAAAMPEGEGAHLAALDLTAVEAILKRYDNAAPAVRQAAGRRIERGPVGNLLKAVHGYKCQICSALNHDAVTFLNAGGLPYVEAHHVDLVSSGLPGSLRAENVIVVCPTHHRELHYGAMARITDHGHSFEVRVELGTVIIPKSSLALISETTAASSFRAG